ncbi:uncharacterized protein LOC120431759 [Culex pipiens pallens]|uniref:uncharacterized protein LOC120431759 n=1 Tax=Culex pipiens pallens TaxID=42434 RepID=UPI0022AB16D1|nr:uncharacterized protein LOC120431759 [Culex pipiens pallens]
MKHKNRLKLVRVPESGSLLKLRGGDVGIVQVVNRMIEYTDCPAGPILPGAHSIERFLAKVCLTDAVYAVGGRDVDLHRLYSVVVARWTKLKLKQIYIRFSNKYDKVNFNGEEKDPTEEGNNEKRHNRRLLPKHPEEQFAPVLDGPSVRKTQVQCLTNLIYFQTLSATTAHKRSLTASWNICVILEGGRSDRDLSVQALYFPAGKLRLPFPNQQTMANSSKPVLMMAGNETTLFSTTLSRSKMKAAMLLPNETSIRNLLSIGPSDVTGGVP